MADLVQELRELVEPGDYGDVKYLKHRVQHKLAASIDRYRAVVSKAPALLFRNACNAVAASRGQHRLPENPAHLNQLLRVEDMRRFVRRAMLPGYRTKLSFPADEAYVYPFESWLQSGNRESPIHIDHGRVVSIVPPSLTHTFKIWVFYRRPECAQDEFNFTKTENTLNRMLKTSCAIQAQDAGKHEVRVVVCATDRYDSYRYAARLPSGSQYSSSRAWTSILSAFCVMEGR
ncbi:hypothetical protein PHYSODRAFT_315976 [Phytophthora sojae]|uniref:Uncharacterized protein n=1 Tax=Phytophthora sojae (strain P6497) TaxID=1094619 RepID=G4ZPI1_PHYSP|nr:hypothetical protein PHYSODRAFT_315976 [Phytophthora sojae]EGZ15805.1 hypothetical protein PHYSODRAFT_315976 [Phytophthora sojae]|eukprot:XP_009529554.1 hypothetical protein PHYSODRAFT_315976 [Phytophthora sojae]